MSHPVLDISFTAPDAVLVEASAGTGKTWTIERLYIKSLLEATNPLEINLPLTVENILVVTFTNAAADELKSRISQQIQDTIKLLIYLHNAPTNLNFSKDIFSNYLIEHGQTDGYKKDITLLTRALQNFDAASIYTIHGFCNKIVHDYPFFCGVNPMFKLTTNKADLIERLVVNFIRSRIINNESLKPDIDVVINNLDKLFIADDYKLGLAERVSSRLPKDIFQISNAGIVFKYELNTVANLEYLRKKELSEDEKVKARAGFFAALIDYLVIWYNKLNQNSNLLSYDELIQTVSTALAKSPQIRDKLYYNFPVTFIDEFQDTDNAQWQIFSHIYQLDVADMKVRGNLVVVGDPKQAIYRFRGADIDTYLRAREQIGKQLTLNCNFRSKPNILNFINQLFALNNQGCTINNSFFGPGIEYTKSITAGEDFAVLPSVGELDLIMQELGVIEKSYDNEVQLVVIKGAKKDIRNNKLLMNMTFEILSLLAVKPELIGKIAILVTKKSEATKVIMFLRKYGVRATELHLGNIYATRTANDVYLILLALLNLEDRKIFFQALKCKLLNIPLIHLLDNDDENLLVTEWQQQFFAFGQIWQTGGITSLIYAIISAIITNNSKGELRNNDYGVFSNRELANIWQLAELINKQSQKLVNQIELLTWLKSKIDKAVNGTGNDLENESEELIRLDNDDEQITVTTQHKAKGMEYEILFCPYFKSGISTDGKNYNYQRPFFSSYSKDGKVQSEMVIDKDIMHYILERENNEIHRLNYVALTRAKSRIYIYLKQNTRDFRNPKKYSSLERPDKLIELFGYNKFDPEDNSHPLFNYSQFFTSNPVSALKHKEILPGVVTYSRDELTANDLYKLKFNPHELKIKKEKFHYVNDQFSCSHSYSRQSYTSLTTKDFNLEDRDYYEKDEGETPHDLKYRYSILNDPNLKGAIFGTLFHRLCENYPLNRQELIIILNDYNIDSQDYIEQLTNMLEEAFNYPIFANFDQSSNLSNKNICLNDLSLKIHELKFNLLVANTVEIRDEFCNLITDYFGSEHQFSIASSSLAKIEAGFLLGAIDLLFEHEGKYWVLDYKTNKLADYNPYSTSGQIVESMAEHHYYLQYLLYLVAVKRYLESRLQVPDATELIGGAVYYYVRGVYANSNTQKDQGVYIDSTCNQLVAEIDKLLRGRTSS